MSTKKAYLDINSLCRLNMVMSPDKDSHISRAVSGARAWLRWSQEELHKRSTVSLSTIKDFERAEGARLPLNNRAALRRAIEEAGICWFLIVKGPQQGSPRRLANRFDSTEFSTYSGGKGEKTLKPGTKMVYLSTHGTDVVCATSVH